MADSTADALRQMLASRKTILGIAAIIGTQIIVAIGVWRALPKEYVLTMAGGLVTPILAIIQALGKEDAAKAMPATTMTPEHVQAIANATTANMVATLSQAPGALPGSATIPVAMPSILPLAVAARPSPLPSAPVPPMAVPRAPSVPDIQEPKENDT